DGIGLSNVRERLSVQFEGRAGHDAGPRESEWVSEISLPEIDAYPNRPSRRTLREYCEAEGDLSVIGEYRDGATALTEIRAKRPQLLFLDIQMDLMNGIDLARALKPEELPSLVFVTAYDTYALEAFEVCAIDYLLKPFDQERFRKTLGRVRPRHLTSGVDERQTLLAGLLAQLERGARGTGEEK